MPDITTISAALTSLKAATDIAKVIRQAGISLEKAEHKYQLADLLSALADAMISISSIQEDVIAKDRHIRELQARLTFKEQMKYISPFYWTEGETHDGPFCQRCYDDQQKANRIHLYDTNLWVCKVCQSSYYPRPSELARQPQEIQRDLN
jgi:hypothetical protein